MLGARRILLLGAALTLVLPSVALRSGTSASAAPLQMAQYDGGPYGPGYGGVPYDGYGPPDVGPGDFGPPEGGRGPSRRRSLSGGGGRTIAYHGFKLVVSGNADLAAAEHQVDIVDQAGLGAADMRLFRGRSIAVTGQGGSESQRGTSVVLGNLQSAQSRPVLLHEYMHILHRSKLPGGFNNPTIMRFYQEARANNLYPADSYVMSNQREFFAVTASCFLYGTVERPPFNRETIRQQQPGYYAYLAHLFGRG